MKKYVFQRTSSCFTPFQPPLLSAPFITSALSSVSIFFLLLAANVSTSNCPSCPNYFGRDDLKILPTTFTLKAAGLNTTDELSIYVWDNLAVFVCISSSRDSLTRLGCHLRRETYPNIFFFFFQKKSHSSCSTSGETWESLAFFFCSASDPVWSPPITLTLLDYIFNDNLNRGVTFLAFFIFVRGQASVRQSLRAQCQKNMRVVSTSVKRDRMCEKAGTLENVRVKRRTNWIWL